MFIKEKRFFTVVFFILVLVIGFFVGYVLGARSQSTYITKANLIISPASRQVNRAGKDVDFELFWQVWDMVKQDYFKQPVSDTDLFYGALRGLVSGLQDPYSIFLDPEYSEEFAKELEGNFEGIGAEIGIKKGQLKIIAPLPGTPAQKAGLMAGDNILAIDDIDSRSLTLEAAVNLIRGERGTEVILLIADKDEPLDVKEVVIVRDVIQVQSVSYETRENENVFVITINHFSNDTLELFREAVTEVFTKQPQGIILDLRNNPGGFLDTAVKIAGYWTGKQIVVYEKSASGIDTNYQAATEALLSEYQTVVLINGGSASGSEIVAGALKSFGLATLIGENTFGKGTVQNLESLPDGSSLKLTVAEWLTPDKISINEVGISPDIFVELSEDDYNNDLDPQMDKALEYLLNK